MSKLNYSKSDIKGLSNTNKGKKHCVHCEEQELTRHLLALVLQKLTRLVELQELQQQGRVL